MKKKFGTSRFWRRVQKGAVFSFFFESHFLKSPFKSEFKSFTFLSIWSFRADDPNAHHLFSNFFFKWQKWPLLKYSQRIFFFSFSLSIPPLSSLLSPSRSIYPTRAGGGEENEEKNAQSLAVDSSLLPILEIFSNGVLEILEYFGTHFRIIKIITNQLN